MVFFNGMEVRIGDETCTLLKEYGKMMVDTTAVESHVEVPENPRFTILVRLTPGFKWYRGVALKLTMWFDSGRGYFGELFVRKTQFVTGPQGYSEFSVKRFPCCIDRSYRLVVLAMMPVPVREAGKPYSLGEDFNVQSYGHLTVDVHRTLLKPLQKPIKTRYNVQRSPLEPLPHNLAERQNLTHYIRYARKLIVTVSKIWVKFYTSVDLEVCRATFDMVNAAGILLEIERSRRRDLGVKLVWLF